MLQEEAAAVAVIDTTPSAPVATDLPSAPPLAPVETYQSNECVVCLENKVIRCGTITPDSFLKKLIFAFSATSSFFHVGMCVHVGNARQDSPIVLSVALLSPKRCGSISGSFSGGEQSFPYPFSIFLHDHVKIAGFLQMKKKQRIVIQSTFT